MTWSAAGVQTGTDTDLSGLTSVTGTTSVVIGNVTVWTVTSTLTIQGTLTMDPLTEMLLVNHSNVNSVNVTTGTFNIGSSITSSFGNGLRDILPLQTAIIFEKSGPGCCNNGPFTVGSSGTLNWYAAAINLNGCFDVDGTVLVRNGIMYSHNDDGNCRWRSNATPSNYDIDGLITYGIQFDSLVDGTFGNFVNFLPLDKGIPIENATGTTGAVRAWRQMPDNTYAASALMNNWQGAKDVQIYLSEPGSRTVVVPDSITSGTGHGARLYHEFTVSAFDVLNAPIEDVICYIEDYDNGDRVTTTTAGGSISQGDQVLTPITGVTGITTLQTLLTAMLYRTDTGTGDLTSPNGLERTDCRSKPYSVLCDISGSTGVTGTFGSTDSSLPNLVTGQRFVLNGSTSNDTQVWEADEDWTGGNGGDASRLTSNSTNETENAMDMIVLGEDRYDVYLWGYNHLPYKFTDAVMKGLTQLDLVATMLEDSGISESDPTVVAAYAGISTLDRLYDAAKEYKVDTTNIVYPTVGDWLIERSGSLIDLGTADLIVDGDAGSAFAYASGPEEITINPTDAPDIVLVGTVTTAVSSGEDDEITVAFPTGIQDDDFALLIIGHAEADDNAWNTPSGWTVEVAELQTGGTPTSIPGVTVFRRLLSGDSGSVTVTNVGTNVSGIVGQMRVYRNLDTTTQIEVTTVTATGATGDPDPGSITPTNDRSMIVAIGFQDDGDQTNPTAPAGYGNLSVTKTLDGGDD